MQVVQQVGDTFQSIYNICQQAEGIACSVVKDVSTVTTTNISLTPTTSRDKKERDGQWTPPTPPVVLLDVVADPGLAVRHRGPLRFVGISGTTCVMMESRDSPNILEPLNNKTIVYFSGDSNYTRPL